jgi:hypothetical protein
MASSVGSVNSNASGSQAKITALKKELEQEKKL